jgi:hypothetical protein
MSAANLLIEKYYESTSIDTDVIVKKVANQVQKQQDYLVYMVKKRMNSQDFVMKLPVVYWAQSA